MSVLPAAYQNTIVNYLRGAGAPTAITDIFLDLYNGDPQGAGSSVLATITGSATRSSVASAMGAASAGVSTNSADITVTGSASGVATVTYVALFDAATNGNLLMSVSTGTVPVASGQSVKILASNMTIQIS